MHADGGSFAIGNYGHRKNPNCQAHGSRSAEMRSVNDIRHAEHVICMMAAGNYNEAFISPPRALPDNNQIGLEAARDKMRKVLCFCSSCCKRDEATPSLLSLDSCVQFLREKKEKRNRKKKRGNGKKRRGGGEYKKNAPSRR